MFPFQDGKISQTISAETQKSKIKESKYSTGFGQFIEKSCDTSVG